VMTSPPCPNCDKKLAVFGTLHMCWCCTNCGCHFKVVADETGWHLDVLDTTGIQWMPWEKPYVEVEQ